MKKTPFVLGSDFAALVNYFSRRMAHECSSRVFVATYAGTAPLQPKLHLIDCVLSDHYSGRSEGGLKKTSRKGSLSDPTHLPPLDRDSHAMQVIIETPKGSRNKYAFDPELRIFQLKKVLPAGMSFPYDFGFVPSTKAEDGDPFDVLVLMDEPAFTGCLLKCRLVGIIEGEQGKKKKDRERNDRVVAIEQDNHSFAHVKHVRDLGKKFVRELEEFFVNYHQLSGQKYRILDVKGPGEAWRRIEERINGRAKRSL